MVNFKAIEGILDLYIQIWIDFIIYVWRKKSENIWLL